MNARAYLKQYFVLATFGVCFHFVFVFLIKNEWPPFQTPDCSYIQAMWLFFPQDLFENRGWRLNAKKQKPQKWRKLIYAHVFYRLWFKSSLSSTTLKDFMWPNEILQILPEFWGSAFGSLCYRSALRGQPGTWGSASFEF